MTRGEERHAFHARVSAFIGRHLMDGILREMRQRRPARLRDSDAPRAVVAPARLSGGVTTSAAPRRRPSPTAGDVLKGGAVRPRHRWRLRNSVMMYPMRWRRSAQSWAPEPRPVPCVVSHSRNRSTRTGSVGSARSRRDERCTGGRRHVTPEVEGLARGVECHQERAWPRPATGVPDGGRRGRGRRRRRGGRRRRGAGGPGDRRPGRGRRCPDRRRAARHRGRRRCRRLQPLLLVQHGGDVGRQHVLGTLAAGDRRREGVLLEGASHERLLGRWRHTEHVEVGADRPASKVWPRSIRSRNRTKVGASSRYTSRFPAAIEADTCATAVATRCSTCERSSTAPTIDRWTAPITPLAVRTSASISSSLPSSSSSTRRGSSSPRIDRPAVFEAQIANVHHV